MEEDIICVFCHQFTTSNWRITKNLNSTILSMFDGEYIKLLNFYMCYNCHAHVLEAKDILQSLHQLQSRLKAITTNLRNLMNENPAVTLNASETRSQPLNFVHQFETAETESLKDPLSLEEETFTEQSEDNFCDLTTPESESRQSATTADRVFDSNENDKANHVLRYDRFADVGSTKRFSDAESRVLWEEYLRHCRKTKNKTLSTQIWCKIASVVSNVYGIKRAVTQCKSRIRWLKKARLERSSSCTTPAWIKYVEMNESERKTKQSKPECESEGTGFDSQGNEDDGSNHVADSPFSQNEDDGSICVRSKRGKIFSDEECRVLWQEYSRRRRESKDGKLPIQLWPKIAQVVSKVNDRKRTSYACHMKLQRLKKLWKSTRNIPVWLKYEELDEAERKTEQSESKPKKKDKGSRTESALDRSQNFTDAESIVLWKEYLRHRRKSVDGTLTFRIWTKIARIVSKVDGVERKQKECRAKIQNLKKTATGKPGNKHAAPIPVWLKYEEVDEDEKQTDESSEAESEQNMTSEIFKTAEKFSISEIRILWNEYIKRKSEIDEAPINQKAKIWGDIAKIHRSLCKTNRTFQQCRYKVRGLINKGLDLEYGLPQPDDRDDNNADLAPVSEILPLPSVYTIITQDGPVQLKTEVLELPKCDDFIQPTKITNIPTTLPISTTTKLRRRLLRLKKSRRAKVPATFKAKEVPCSAVNVSEKGSNIVDKPYKCSKCTTKKKFSTESQLEAHRKKSHSVRLNCIATTCRVTFTNITNLELHIKNEHTEIQPEHVCESSWCSRKYYTEEGLKAHVDRSHDESKKDFPCEFCDKKYSSSSRLRKHHNLAHIAASYPCQYCDRVFKTNYMLFRHQGQRHANMDPKKFKPELRTCNICGYVALTRNYLEERHMRIHTKDS